MAIHCLSEGKPLPDYSLTDNFQVALRLFGRIENPAFLIFVKEIQKSRSEDNKLNVFDLMALYKTAKGTSHRNTDTETLNKLLREGMLIESEEGMKLPALYDEISARVAEQMAKRGETDGETDGETELTERQSAILQLVVLYPTLSAGEMAKRMETSKRTIDRDISFLRKNGYLGKEGKANNSPWIVLKKP